MKRVVTLVLSVLVISVTGVTGVAAQRDPIHFDQPDIIQFAADRFTLPDPAQYIEQFGEGLRAFIAEDATTETVELIALVGASRLDDPPGKHGLARAVAHAARSQAGVSEALYAMAGRLTVDVDNEHTRFHLSILSEDFARGVELLASIIREPTFDTDALDAFRRVGAAPPWSPEDPRSRPEFEFPKLVYGDHPAGRVATTQSLAALEVSDLRSFHAAYYVPNNTVLAVSGGFQRARAVEVIETVFSKGSWTTKQVSHPPVPPIPRVAPRQVHVFDVDRLQGWMLAGHLGRLGRERDHAALEVANYILGGGGGVWKRVHPELPPPRAEGHFDARLFNESRAKRGLSNDTSSYVPAGFRVRGLTYAVTLGRPESIAYLLKIIDDEWRAIREDVPEADIEIAKGALTEGYFQMRYAGAHATARSLAEELFFEGNHDWSQNYVEAVRAVTKEQVVAAARKYYRPEELVAVLVGPINLIRTSQHELYSAKLEDFGEIVEHPW